MATTLSFQVISGIASLIPLLLIWNDFEGRLTPEQVRVFRHPAILGVFVIGTVHNATSSVRATVLAVACAAVLVSDMPPRGT